MRNRFRFPSNNPFGFGFVAASISVAVGMVILFGALIWFLVSLTSCAPRFHPTMRPADTELRTTPH